MIKIVIITLNYNQNEYTLKCIASILKSNFENFSILLIDNGSTTENYISLREQLSKDSKIFLKRLEQNRGYVGGINYGLEQGAKVNPDYFLIMNNDTILDKDAISELVSTFKNYHNNAIVTGKVYHYDEPNRLQDIGYTFKNEKKLLFNHIGLNETDNGQYDNISERDMLDDVYWLFPFDLYNEIGGYSPYFWFNAEQADFALRAKKANYKLVYTPKAKLWHKGSLTIGGRIRNPQSAYWTIQSSLILRYLHLRRLFFYQFYIRIILGITTTYIKALISIQERQKKLLYANAKFQGLIYFNKWLFRKNINIGFIPKKIKQ